MNEYTCTLCGAYAADAAAHVRWHLALADIWSWIERVSGSSCETAREILGGPRLDGPTTTIRHDMTARTHTMSQPYDYDAVGLTSYPFEPSMQLQAGDQLGYTNDGKTVGVYRDGTLVEVWKLRDGAMRLDRDLTGTPSYVEPEPHG